MNQFRFSIFQQRPISHLLWTSAPKIWATPRDTSQGSERFFFRLPVPASADKLIRIWITALSASSVDRVREFVWTIVTMIEICVVIKNCGQRARVVCRVHAFQRQQKLKFTKFDTIFFIFVKIQNQNVNLNKVFCWNLNKAEKWILQNLKIISKLQIEIYFNFFNDIADQFKDIFENQV